MADATLNPLLAKVKLPGRVFQLPSKGLFYEKGVLADTVKDGEVHIKPMSALTEIKMRSADLLISNKILYEVCEECAPEIKKPDELVAKDVDALFMFLVMSTYGNKKSIKSKHFCSKGELHDYEIDLGQIESKPNNEALQHRDVLYSVDLPNGQRVHLKPVTFSNSVMMATLRQTIAKSDVTGSTVSSENMEALVLQDLMSVIRGVDTDSSADKITVTDENMIRQWLKAISRTYVELIVEASTKAAEWGFSFELELQCKDCGETYKHDLELNPINFFNG